VVVVEPIDDRLVPEKHAVRRDPDGDERPSFEETHKEGLPLLIT
jgi:hypothetical protein